MTLSSSHSDDHPTHFRAPYLYKEAPKSVIISVSGDPKNIGDKLSTCVVNRLTHKDRSLAQNQTNHQLLQKQKWIKDLSLSVEICSYTCLQVQVWSPHVPTPEWDLTIIHPMSTIRHPMSRAFSSCLAFDGTLHTVLCGFSSILLHSKASYSLEHTLQLLPPCIPFGSFRTCVCMHVCHGQSCPACASCGSTLHFGHRFMCVTG